MFYRVNEKGKQIRRAVTVDCSNDKVLTEQSHKKEVDINEIVKRHGVDKIAQTQQLVQMQYDDIPGNDFMETMLMLKKAETSFMSLPSKLRARFENDPAQYLDFVRNPDNAEELVTLGLANPPPAPDEPVQVQVVNTEPPATEPQ